MSFSLYFTGFFIFQAHGDFEVRRQRTERLVKAKVELEQVDAAIAAIQNGAQSYRIGSRGLTRADLKTLYVRKDMLEDLVTALSGGSGRFRQVVHVG